MQLLASQVPERSRFPFPHLAEQMLFAYEQFWGRQGFLQLGAFLIVNWGCGVLGVRETLREDRTHIVVEGFGKSPSADL